MRHRKQVFFAALAWGTWRLSGYAQATAALDLSKAVIFCPANLSKTEAKALELLVDEVQKRTLIRWQVAHAWPADSIPVIAVGPAVDLEAIAGRYAPKLAAAGREKAAEGYRISVERAGRGAPAVFILGNDSR